MLIWLTYSHAVIVYHERLFFYETKSSVRICGGVGGGITLTHSTGNQRLIIFNGNVNFTSVPCRLASLSHVRHAFCSIGRGCLTLLHSIPRTIFLTTSSVTSATQRRLSYALGTGLACTLTSRLGFTVRHDHRKLGIRIPLTCSVRRLCPRRCTVTGRKLRRLYHALTISLPSARVIDVTVRVVATRGRIKSVRSAVLATGIVSRLSTVIRRNVRVRLGGRDFDCSQFYVRLQCLMRHVVRNDPLSTNGTVSDVFIAVHGRCPRICAYMRRVSAFLRNACK